MIPEHAKACSFFARRFSPFLARRHANSLICPPNAGALPGAPNQKEEGQHEQIEQIDWSHPTIRRLTDHEDELGLPEGYGFELTDIRYQHSGRYFVAEVRTSRQYLGDVSDYQAQITELNEKLAEQQAALETQTAQAAAAVSSMEAAYHEGVESNG